MPTRRLVFGRDDLAPAIACLRAGGLVAFPTETVYGLGARADDPAAIARVFAAKERPHDNPLIVHLADAVAVIDVVAGWNEAARTLAAAFWPGALTLVARRHPGFPPAASAGLETVAVRVPDHDAARALLREAGPLAAPSANRSGRPSPTTADHVLADLDGRIDFVLDAGPCLRGLESTVVDVSGDAPEVLRPGAIPIEDLRDRCDGLIVHPVVDRPQGDADARAPGMRHRHYSPSATLVLYEGPAERAAAAIARALADDPRSHALVFDADVAGPHVRTFADVEAAAHELYAALRDLDDADVPTVHVQAPADRGLGRTLLNRLRKAATRVERV